MPKLGDFNPITRKFYLEDTPDEEEIQQYAPQEQTKPYYGRGIDWLVEQEMYESGKWKRPETFLDNIKMPEKPKPKTDPLKDFLEALETWDAMHKYEKGGNVVPDKEPTSNVFLQSMPMALSPNEQGYYHVPWYEEMEHFKGHNHDEKYPESLLADQYKGQGLTYGDVYAMFNQETRNQIRNAGGKTEDENWTLNERRRAMGLKPDLGPTKYIRKTISEEDAYKDLQRIMGKQYDNVLSMGMPIWLDNYRDSHTYKVQNARYQDELRKRGLPIRNFDDGSIRDDRSIVRYTDLVNTTYEDPYGKKWNPIKELSYKNQQEGSYLAHGEWGAPDTLVLNYGVDKDRVDNYNSIIDIMLHEYSHTGNPSNPLPTLTNYNLDDRAFDYFTKNSGTEIAARLSQVLNYNNIKTSDEINKMSSDDLKSFFFNYLYGWNRDSSGNIRQRPSGVDNNMYDLYMLINYNHAWDQLTDWMKGSKDNWNVY